MKWSRDHVLMWCVMTEFMLTVDLHRLRVSVIYLKPHCIQSSQVLVPAVTSKSTLRRHGIQAVTRVMAYVADAVTL
jgi:hypothetical protein